jgi:hypothetical protein
LGTWACRRGGKKVVPEIEKIMEERRISSPILAFRTYFDELEGIEGEDHFKRFSNFCEKVLGVGPSISVYIQKLYAFIYPYEASAISDDRVYRAHRAPKFTSQAKSNEHLLKLIRKQREEMQVRKRKENPLLSPEDLIIDPSLALEDLIRERMEMEREKNKKDAEELKVRELRHFELFQHALAGLFNLDVEEVKEEFLKDGALLRCFYYPEEFKKENERRRHQFGR